jgi:alanine racemase
VLNSYLNIISFLKRKKNNILILINNVNQNTISKILFFFLLKKHFYIYRNNNDNLLFNFLNSCFTINDIYDYILIDSFITSLLKINFYIKKLIENNSCNIGILNNKIFNDVLLDKDKKNIIESFSNFDYLIFSTQCISLYNFIFSSNHFYNTVKITWGYEFFADLIIKRTIYYNNKIYLVIYYNNENITIVCKKYLTYNQHDIIISFIILKILNFTDSEIINYLTNIIEIHTANIEIIEAKKNHTVILKDTCKNGIFSLEYSLSVLSNYKNHNKTLILIDKHKTNFTYFERKYYHNLFTIIHKFQLNKIIITGNKNFLYRIYNSCVDYCSNTLELKKKINNLLNNNEVILFKSTYNSIFFEDIINYSTLKTHVTIYKISINQLVNNLNFFNSQINNNTKTMIMVKAFSYGFGYNYIIHLIAKGKVDYLAVATIDEGVKLRKQNIKVPILVTNPNYLFFEKMLKYNLEPEIMNFFILNKFICFIKKNIKYFFKIPIHIKLDTGMHRQGFLNHEIGVLGCILRDNNIKVSSIFSHLSDSDSYSNNLFTIHQIYIFDELYHILTSYLGYKPLKHILNTSGIIFFPYAQYDMIRLGIGLYGVHRLKFIQQNISYIGSLESIIYQIKFIKIGDYIGYSSYFKNDTHQLKIGIVPIGYADGIDRNIFFKNIYVLVNNFKSYVIGFVCMDMLMIDISHIDCGIGDKVIIFNDIILNNFILKSKKVSYEILSSLSQRINRIYFF